jgi:hypothetical protein
MFRTHTFEKDLLRADPLFPNFCRCPLVAYRTAADGFFEQFGSVKNKSFETPSTTKDIFQLYSFGLVDFVDEKTVC